MADDHDGGVRGDASAPLDLDGQVLRAVAGDASTSNATTRIDTLSLDPPSATLRVVGSTPATLQFRALGSSQDGSTSTVNATFSTDLRAPGQIGSASGLFTSSNVAGGVVTVTASYQGKQATATLTVLLADEEIVGASLPANVRDLFDPAQNQIVRSDPTRAPSIVYPVPETMFPQNLAHVLFQWRPSGGKIFQLTFQSDSLDYKVYTDGMHDICTKAATGGACWQSDDSSWQKLATSNAGQTVKLMLRATDPAHPGTVYEALPVSFHFSQQSVPGAIYYWSTTAKGVRRGRMEDLTPKNFFTPAEADGNCVACHTLSRDGKRMAADVGGENLWVVDVNSTVPPPRRFTDYQNKSIASSFATFNPDTSRIVSAKNGQLTLRDGNTGAPIGPSAGVIPLSKNLATMPDWAPDGSQLVFALGPNAKGRKATAASIARLSVTGDLFGALETIVPSTGSADDNSWPMFDPTSQWIAFVKSSSSSEKDPTAQVHIVKAAPSATSQPLTRANTLVNDAVVATGLYNNMPTWAPTHEGGLEWVAFTSTRDYGVVLANHSTYGNQLRQLWIAAIDTSKLGTGDPSYPAFHVPFQELSENSHRPFWAEDALATDDAGMPDAGTGGPTTDADAGAPPSDAGSGASCIPENGDCAKGNCCSGFACSPLGDSYACLIYVQ